MMNPIGPATTSQVTQLPKGVTRSLRNEMYWGRSRPMSMYTPIMPIADRNPNRRLRKLLSSSLYSVNGLLGNLPPGQPLDGNPLKWFSPPRATCMRNCHQNDSPTTRHAPDDAQSTAIDSGPVSAPQSIGYPLRCQPNPAGVAF